MHVEILNWNFRFIKTFLIGVCDKGLMANFTKNQTIMKQLFSLLLVLITFTSCNNETRENRKYE